MGENGELFPRNVGSKKKSVPSFPHSPPPPHPPPCRNYKWFMVWDCQILGCSQNPVWLKVVTIHRSELPLTPFGATPSGHLTAGHMSLRAHMSPSLYPLREAHTRPACAPMWQRGGHTYLPVALLPVPPPLLLYPRFPLHVFYDSREQQHLLSLPFLEAQSRFEWHPRPLTFVRHHPAKATKSGPRNQALGSERVR